MPLALRLLYLASSACLASEEYRRCTIGRSQRVHNRSASRALRSCTHCIAAGLPLPPSPAWCGGHRTTTSASMPPTAEAARESARSRVTAPMMHARGDVMSESAHAACTETLVPQQHESDRVAASLALALFRTAFGTFGFVCNVPGYAGDDQSTFIGSAGCIFF